MLRESYREHGKVRKKRTLCNLSDWPKERVEALRAVLKGGTVIPAERQAADRLRSALAPDGCPGRHRGV